MFTEEDLKKLKRIKIDYQRKESESNGSSALDQRSEDGVYISRYFLNQSFKILHIDIIGTQIVGSSSSRGDSYMIYIIKVLTEEFSYEVRRRYSQFLKLYQNVLNLQALRNRQQTKLQINKIKLNSLSKFDYTFPIKKLSSSLLHFFNMTNKEKLAEERRCELCAFLNQIKNNYYKLQDQFIQDYVELLKFIDMKQQHQKYWRRKQGRLIQLSSIALKDSNQPNLMKDSQKKGEAPVNVEYLSELLQHQINKINLAIVARQSMRKSNTSLRETQQQSLLKDPLVTDQIIKNVDCIKDIVLELKRKISYEHIRCILKGKDLRDDSNSNYSNSKKGLIEYSLKYTNNQLVSMHILKILINVFLNSECNYSSEIFIKLLSEVQLGVFALTQQKQILCISNKEYRQIYFKLLKIYFLAKQQYGNNKKFNSQNLPIGKLMGLMLCSMFMAWIDNNQKNKQFKLRDEQKQWIIVIQNQPKLYKNLKILQEKPDVIKKTEQINNLQDFYDQNNERKNQIIKQRNHFFLSKKTELISAKLKTIQEEDYSQYKITAIIKNLNYRECVEFAKNQKNWNKFLLRTETDVYSHTRKDFIKIPGRQEKMFRFMQRQEIQMDLHEDPINEEQIETYRHEQIVNYENFIHDDNCQEIYEPRQIEKDPKTSIQTMPSTSGSYAYNIKPEENDQRCQDLAMSRLSQEFVLVKSPPKQGVINSYSQKVRVKRLSIEGSQLEILMTFSQPAIMKYFSSQVIGATQNIWQGLCQALQNCVRDKSGSKKRQ